MAKDLYEQAVNPSFGQQLLEGLIAAASNLGQPGSGITLLDIMRQGRSERAMTDLLQKIGAGPQVAGPPSPPVSVPPINLGGFGQTLPATLPAQAPQASPEMEQRFTMENLFKIASLPGADVNKAMQFLQTTGKIQDPVAKRQQELEKLKQVGQKERETARLKLTERGQNIQLKIADLRQKGINERSKSGKITPGTRASILNQYPEAKRLHGDELYLNYAEYREQQKETGLPTRTFLEWRALPENQFPPKDEWLKEQLSLIADEGETTNTGGSKKTREERAAELKKQIAEKKITPQKALETLNEEYPEGNAQ